MRFWLARWLVGPMQVELRHGSARARGTVELQPYVQRLDIPVEVPHGVVDSPMGRLSTDFIQGMIHASTPIQACDKDLHEEVFKVCPACGAREAK